MPLEITHRIAAAAACATAACVPIAAADQGTAPQTRYFDVEANKAANMRALGLHMVTEPRAR